MKRIALALFATILFAACSGKSTETETEDNQSQPAPDNSNATNPSIPDTLHMDTVTK